MACHQTIGVLRQSSLIHSNHSLTCVLSSFFGVYIFRSLSQSQSLSLFLFYFFFSSENPGIRQFQNPCSFKSGHNRAIMSRLFFFALAVAEEPKLTFENARETPKANTVRVDTAKVHFLSLVALHQSSNHHYFSLKYASRFSRKKTRI